MPARVHRSAASSAAICPMTSGDSRMVFRMLRLLDIHSADCGIAIPIPAGRNSPIISSGLGFVNKIQAF